MANLAAVADALLARMAELQIGSPALPIAMPDVAFVPPDGAYLAVMFRSIRPAWEGVSDGRLDEGALQVDVVVPRGRGVIPLMEIAQAVIDHFPKGQRFGPAKISREPFVSSPVMDGDRSLAPVTIPWTA